MSTTLLRAEQFQAMAHMVRVGISVIDLVEPDDPESWVIAFNNPAASQASRVDVEVLRGQRFLQAFPAIRETPFIEWYQQVYRERRELELPEVTYGDARVPEASFRVWLSPLPGTAVLGQYVNVTEQRRAEIALRDLNASLEKQVVDRTAELVRSRRTLQEVAHAVAHDLQTPLQHLLALMDLADHQRTPLDGQRLVQLKTEATTMRRIVDALLSYTTQPVNSMRRRCVVGELLQRALEASKPWPKHARVDCEVNVDEVWVIPDAFEMLLVQLLKNALCFTQPASTPKVQLALWGEAGDLWLSVRDEGIGIAPHQQSTVFEAFRRLHSPAQYPGVGLGLALCRGAVEAHEGSIELDSKVDQGSTFKVWLPAGIAANS